MFSGNAFFQMGAVSFHRLSVFRKQGLELYRKIALWFLRTACRFLRIISWFLFTNRSEISRYGSSTISKYIIGIALLIRIN